MNGRLVARRILVIRTDKIGDLVLSLPAIRAVRRSFPDAELTLLVSPYNAPVVDGWSIPDRVETYDMTWPLSRKLAAVASLRARHFDVCIVLHSVIGAYVLARATAARVRVGVVKGRVVFDRLSALLMLTHRYISREERAGDRGEPAEHEVMQTRRVVELAGVEWAGDALELPRHGPAEAWAEAFLTASAPGTRWFGLHLSGKWFESGWTPRQLLDLMGRVARSADGGRLVVTHGPGDRDAVSRVLAEARAATFDRAGLADGVALDREGRVMLVGVDFPQLVSVTARCTLVVSRDTGSLHVASAVGRPVVAVFAPYRFRTQAGKWAPWGVPFESVCDGAFDDVAARIVAGVGALLAAVDGRRRETGEALNPWGA